MKVLVTGHNGYIGSVLVQVLQTAGHKVHGLDAYLFEGCTFGPPVADVPAMRKDVRDVQVADLQGYDAVIHLAALCNDPVGNLNPKCTFEVNHLASYRLAECAKRAGVGRFLFSSSCSLYGVAGDTFLDEHAGFNPITPYGASKILVEQDVTGLADDDFCPTFLRNATAYGVSPRLRADLVVNNLVGYAFTTGEVLIMSDGTPWRPLVHVEDICRAFLAVLEAPRELVFKQAFNVGNTRENYRVSEVADLVREIVPGSRIKYAEGAGPDPRCYRVNCDKLANTLDFETGWTVRRGIEQLYTAYKQNGLTEEEFVGPKYLRIKQMLKLQGEGRLNSDLRIRDGAMLARVAPAR